MEKIKLGFVGVGTMGQMAHLQNYATLDDCEIVAVADYRQKLAHAVAARYGIQHIYSDHQSLLKNESLDAIVACLQFRHHATILPDLYPRIKNIFTEKPLAIAVETAETLATAAKRENCSHMVSYHKRSDLAIRFARKKMTEWQQSEKMGNLKYIRILMPAGDWIANGFTGVIASDEPVPEITPEPEPAEFSADAARDYVSFVNYYIHQVNLMHFLLAEPYRVTFAEKRGVVMNIESQSGVPGIIEMTPYQTTVAWEEELLVAFEKGYIKIKLPAPVARHRAGLVEVYEDSGEATPMRYFPTLPWEDAMRQQARNFLRVCRGEIPPPCSAHEAVADLKIAREYIHLRQK